MTKDLMSEIQRIHRVSDLLCTAHSILSGRYEKRSLFLSLAIILLSAWLSAMALANPKYLKLLTPFDIEYGLWMGLLAVFTFSLSLFELKVDWKGLSEAHKSSFNLYVEAKRAAGYLMNTPEEVSSDEYRNLVVKYDMAGAAGINIPDSKFLKLKQKHRLKIEISKKLDLLPAKNVTLLRISLFFRDNWPSKK